MMLTYTKPDGALEEIRLTEQPITIGRGSKADVVIDDEKASRLHCGIRWVDNAYTLKDLSSKNGTFLNDERTETETLKIGDKVRVGNTVFKVEGNRVKGATTTINEVQQAMTGGKGYDTILREIVSEAPTQPKRPKKKAP